MAELLRGIAQGESFARDFEMAQLGKPDAVTLPSDLDLATTADLEYTLAAFKEFTGHRLHLLLSALSRRPDSALARELVVHYGPGNPAPKPKGRPRRALTAGGEAAPKRKASKKPSSVQNSSGTVLLASATQARRSADDDDDDDGDNDQMGTAASVVVAQDDDEKKTARRLPTSGLFATLELQFAELEKLETATLAAAAAASSDRHPLASGEGHRKFACFESLFLCLIRAQLWDLEQTFRVSADCPRFAQVLSSRRSQLHLKSTFALVIRASRWRRIFCRSLAEETLSFMLIFAISSAFDFTEREFSSFREQADLFVSAHLATHPLERLAQTLLPDSHGLSSLSSSASSSSSAAAQSSSSSTGSWLSCSASSSALSSSSSSSSSADSLSARSPSSGAFTRSSSSVSPLASYRDLSAHGDQQSGGQASSLAPTSRTVSFGDARWFDGGYLAAAVNALTRSIFHPAASAVTGAVLTWVLEAIQTLSSTNTLAESEQFVPRFCASVAVFEELHVALVAYLAASQPSQAISHQSAPGF